MSANFHLLPIDFETSGLKIKEKYHQPITAGLILVDYDTLEEIDRIYVECRLEEESHWDIGAEKCHGLSYDYIMEQQSMPEAAAQVLEFLVRNGIESGDYITLLGHNVQFDRECLEAWMDSIDMKLKLTHRMVDTFPVGFTMLGTRDSDELFKMVGVVRNAHDALEDAECALNAVRFCRKIGDEYKNSYTSE